MTNMKSTAIMAVAMATTAATFGPAAPAHADGVVYQFSQPGGTTNCVMGTRNGGQAYAECQIGRYSYQPPSPPPGACPGWGGLFALDQGNPAYIKCDGGPIVYPTPPPLDWGQKRDIVTDSGTIECVTAPGGTLPPSTFCTELPNTAHYFRIYSDRFNMG